MFLPGCTKPLEPPMPVSSMPRRSAECDLSKAEDWLSRKILPSYWVKEADGKNKYPLRVLSENESAHLLMRLENFYAEQGRPVYENVQVQILSIDLLPDPVNIPGPTAAMFPSCHSTSCFTTSVQSPRY